MRKTIGYFLSFSILIFPFTFLGQNPSSQLFLCTLHFISPLKQLKALLITTTTTRSINVAIYISNLVGIKLNSLSFFNIKKLVLSKFLFYSVDEVLAIKALWSSNKDVRLLSCSPLDIQTVLSPPAIVQKQQRLVVSFCSAENIKNWMQQVWSRKEKMESF